MNDLCNEEKLQFSEFDDIAVSTKTFIVMTNITIDIQKLFEFLPITDYIVIPKRRGRKKRLNIKDPNKNIKDGSIITLNLSGNIKGIILKKKKENKDTNKRDFFRNSITVIMFMDNKMINFKISQNGKFQMTGCKFDIHAENCVKQIWEYIKDTDLYKKEKDQPFTATFIPAMRNIDFSLGFCLDREKLDEYFNNNTEYNSLLETSIGYTGANIKIPVKKSITELNLKQIQYKDDWIEPIYVPYKYYLDTLKPKEQQKKLEKNRYNTFLVFHSGKCIMSSMCAEFARETYYEFINIIKKNYLNFEEHLQIEL